MAKNINSKKKVLMLGGLLIGLVAVLIYQFTGTQTARPRLTPSSPPDQRASAPPILTPGQTDRAARGAAPDQELTALVSDLTPVDTSLVARAGDLTINRNVFAYYVPPPAPPPPPPPPPPIALRFIQPQTQVAGTPRSFSLMVTGEGFPPDAQIIFGGIPKPTQQVNSSQLRAEIAATDYSSPRNVNVEVKSQSKPAELYSNAVSFVAQQSPDPPFKFIGVIGDLGVFEVVTASGAKEHMRVRKGGTIEGVWRIDSITDTGVDVTDTRYDIKKRVPL
jgi:hypothetical protein